MKGNRPPRAAHETEQPPRAVTSGVELDRQVLIAPSSDQRHHPHLPTAIDNHHRALLDAITNRSPRH